MSSTSATEFCRRRRWRTWSCWWKQCMPRKALTGVLCMAYGSPRDDAGLEAYYTHIRGGRPPSPQALAELRERYRAIGGAAPPGENTPPPAGGAGRAPGVPHLRG